MYNYKFDFSNFEQTKNEELQIIMNDWILQVSTKNKKTIDNGNKTKRSPARCFAKDGFFPGYFNKKNTKILFIGREPRKIGGYDFRDTTKECFDEWNINNSSWWRRILYIVYGIRHNGELSFEEVKTITAQKILEEMYEKNDFGFACINISKYSNDHPEDWKSNGELINLFLYDSELEKTHLFQRELAFLRPDIIITANLWDGTINESFLDLCLPNKNSLNLKAITHNKENTAEYGKYKLCNKEIDFIDLYHFSHPCKEDKHYYYNPVMKVLFKNKK